MSDESSPIPEPDPPPSTEAADPGSPFPPPPLDVEERADSAREVVTETSRAMQEREPDPDKSPFEVPATEGMPYERGSPEDAAIREVLAEREEVVRRGRKEQTRETRAWA